MKQKIIYLSPKSKEANEFFNLSMKKVHSCKVLRTEEKRILVNPIQSKYQFWVQEKNDEHWELIK